MGVFALKRFAGAEEGSEPRHHLSLVSHDNWSVTANADLPFKNEPVYGSSCRALAYFMGKNGKIVVSNLATRKWKVFSLPDHLSAASSVEVDACGLGYDPISRDYKLFRHIVRYLNEEERVGNKVVALRYLGYEDYTQVYSFKSDCWEAITAPNAAFIIPCAVYVAGSCYWTAVGGLEDDPCRHHILAFDIATKEYNYLSFPQTCFGEEAWSKVVDYRGSLAALIYAGPEASDWTDSSPLFVYLFVRREDSWQMLFDLKFDNVERPLGIGESRDGSSILFLDGKHTIQKSELMVYDFHSKELNRVGIYDHRSHMVVISFDFKEDRPPGSTPMPFIDNIVSSRDLLSNNFSGTIPTSVGDLEHLLTLNLSYNHLNGPIPAEFGNLRSIQTMDMLFNKFSGCIPGELGQLQNLASLILNNNNLSGKIPEQLSNCLSLDKLYNNISGLVSVGRNFSRFAPGSFFGNPLL